MAAIIAASVYGYAPYYVAQSCMAAPATETQCGLIRPLNEREKLFTGSVAGPDAYKAMRVRNVYNKNLDSLAYVSPLEPSIININLARPNPQNVPSPVLHESVHVLQFMGRLSYKHSPSYFFGEIAHQFVSNYSLYDYNIADVQSFSDLNSEQQASAVEDFYMSFRPDLKNFYAHCSDCVDKKGAPNIGNIARLRRFVTEALPAARAFAAAQPAYAVKIDPSKFAKNWGTVRMQRTSKIS